MNQNSNKRFVAWLELLRLPNLFTIPGDIFAGFFLASPIAGYFPVSSIALLAATSLSIYAAGLLLNDFCDRNIDAKERPARPIPSGRAGGGAVLAVSVILNTAALGLAFLAGLNSFFMAAGLVIFSIVYNVYSKNIPVFGISNMALCRSINLLLGASLFLPGFTPPLGVAMGAEFAFIFAVSALAKRETSEIPNIAMRFLPPLLASAGLAALGYYSGCNLFFTIVSAAAVLFMLYISFNIKGKSPRETVPPAIGAFLRSLIILQAAFVLAVSSDTMIFAAAVLCLWPISRLAGRYFHGS
jgi:4-hydroxybenzoate polyprenyltransferase